jgi:DNA-binding NarL/FixJ family response regulator
MSGFPVCEPPGRNGGIEHARDRPACEAVRLQAEASPAPRVVVVEAHPLVRVGLSGIVRNAGFEVADVPSPHDAAGMPEFRADVVVIAVDAPHGSGADGLGLVLAAMPRARAVVLVENADDAGVIGALKAGACGAILKEAANQEIVPAVCAAAAGESALSPAIASRLVRELRRQEPAPPSRYDLTPRELDVLRLLSRGWDNARIAAALYVGRGTVKHNVATIFGKLGVDNRVQAAVEALRAGLLDG